MSATARLLPVLMTVSILSFSGACTRETSSQPSATVGARDADGQYRPDPCLVVATRDGETPAPVRYLARLDQRLEAGVDPVPLLEKIGWYYVGQARENADPGLYTLAEAAADCIDQQDSGSAESLLLKGHVLHSRHRFGEAERLARKLVAGRGLWFDHALLGDVLLDLGRTEDAADAYQRMMSLRPGPQAFQRAAQVRWITGDVPGAIEMLRRAVRTAGGGHLGAWARTRLALLELQERRMSESARHVRAALELQPDYTAALLVRARLSLSRGDPGAALADLERAREREPLPEVRWLIIDVLRMLGRESEARREIAKLADPANREDPRTVALFLATSGERADEALALARAELGARQDVFTLDAMAWASLAAGDVAAARHHSQRAVAGGTQDARLFLHAGIIAAHAGLAGEAMAWMERSRELDHMLFPGERTLLIEAFAGLRSQIRPGRGKTPAFREGQEPTGEHHESNQAT